MNFVFQLVIALVLMVASYLLTPRPKQSSEAAQSMDNPTVSAGSPIKKVYGTVTIKDPNIIWFGEKSTRTFSIKA